MMDARPPLVVFSPSLGERSHGQRDDWRRHLERQGVRDAIVAEEGRPLVLPESAGPLVLVSAAWSFVRFPHDLPLARPWRGMHLKGAPHEDRVWSPTGWGLVERAALLGVRTYADAVALVNAAPTELLHPCRELEDDGAAAWALGADTGALFLDRDGILLADSGYPHSYEDATIYEDLYPAIRTAREAGWPVVVLTNQAGVAKGHFSEGAVARLHVALSQHMEGAGAAPDAWLYCPFHEEGTVAAYATDSVARKPSGGMLLKALERWPIDLRRAIMVGDKDSDCFDAPMIGHTLLHRGRYPLACPGRGVRHFERLADLAATVSDLVRVCR